MRLRTGLLGENPKNIRPLNDTRAIQNGADSLAEGFLFAVAAALILAESYRSSRKDTNRRDLIDDSLKDLEGKIEDLRDRLETVGRRLDERLDEDRERNDEVSRILSRVVEIGLQGGWAELVDKPVRIPAELSHDEVSPPADLRRKEA